MRMHIFKVAKNTSIVAFFMVSSMLPIPASFAGSVDCDDYGIRELRAICKDAPEDHYVIDEVDPKGLNELVEGWGDEPGVYFLPAQVYWINRPVKLKSGQFLLANPPENERFRTISLIAASDFSSGDEFFSLLQLADKTAAGMVEINGELSADIISRNSDKNTRTLVYAPAGTERFMAGCILTGIAGLDYLLWSPSVGGAVSDDYDDNFFNGDYGDYFWTDSYSAPGFQLFRNYFRTRGALTAVELQGGKNDEGNSLRYYGKNNVFIIDGSGSGDSVYTGLRLRQALVGLTANDFVFASGQGAASEYALELQQQQAMVFSHNAFYPSADGYEYSDTDANIFLNQPDKGSWFRFSSNSYNPRASLMISHPQNTHKPNLITNDEKHNIFTGEYPLINTTDFLSFEHDLGTVAIPVSMTLAANPYLGNGTVDYPALQAKAVNDNDDPIDTSIPGQLDDVHDRYQEANRHCKPALVLADVIGLPLIYLAAAVGHIAIPLVAWRFKRPKKMQAETGVN